MNVAGPLRNDRPNSHNEDVRPLFCIAMLSWFGLMAQPQLQPIDSRWVTIRRPAKWQSPPRVLHLKEKTGPGQIMVLYPSGDFGYVGCYLIRRADGTVIISRGDGFVVKIGRWKRNGSTVTITSRTVYRTVVRIGQAIPEPEVVEQFRDISPDGQWRLRTADRQFQPLLTFRDLGFLATVIACDRSYCDGKNYLEGPQPCRPTASEIQR